MSTIMNCYEKNGKAHSPNLVDLNAFHYRKVFSGGDHIKSGTIVNKLEEEREQPKLFIHFS